MKSLADKLKNRHVIVASGSPRRQQFLKDLGIHFEVRLKPIDETFPPTLSAREVPNYLAQLKAKAYLDELQPQDILITGDTVVCFDHQILGKPKSKEEAFEMLSKLSGNQHQVISAACLTSTKKTVSVYGKTTVFFKSLTTNEINYYINTFQPFDKAGAYGIQEWIGKIGIEKIEGSFYNVMGMPIAQVYTALKNF